MLKLKACPRCRGDIHVRQDMYGKYETCLQCGYSMDIPDPNPLLAAAAGKKVA